MDALIIILIVAVALYIVISFAVGIYSFFVQKRIIQPDKIIKLSSDFDEDETYRAWRRHKDDMRQQQHDDTYGYKPDLGPSNIYCNWYE